MNEDHHLRFAVLGPLRVNAGDGIVDVGGTKPRTVLGILLLRANRAVSVDTLAEALWGDEPQPNPAGAIQVHVSRLRKALAGSLPEGKQILITRSPGYVIELDDDQLDLLQFVGLVERARVASSNNDHESASRLLDEALDLWRGPLLGDLPQSGLIEEEARRLDMLQSAARIERLEAEIESGRHAAVVPDLRTRVDANPYDERLQGLLMLALYRDGRPTQALAVYQDLAKALGEELGLEPGPDLRRLEEQILMHDESLQLGQRDLSETVPVGPMSSEGTAVLEMDGSVVQLIGAITTIGRSPDRDVVVNDHEVSRRHAEIRRAGTRYVLVDSGSTNGTIVNDVPESRRELEDGDAILIGDSTLVFRTP